MRYGEIARNIREETRHIESSIARLNALADELDRIEAATPKIDKTLEVAHSKMLMSVKEVAEMMGISRPVVYALVHRDDFPSIKIGARTLINVKKLQEWIDNQTEIEL